MSNFSTETSEMMRASAHVDDVNANIRTLLAKLRAEVETTRSHWFGDAQATFNQLMAAYDNDAAQLNAALKGISEQLSGASRDYSARDAAQSAQLKSAGSGLNMA